MNIRNIFKNLSYSELLKVDTYIPTQKQLSKSDIETIEEIHNSFDTASDRILKEAQDIINKPVNDLDLLKHELGFVNAKGASEAIKLKGLAEENRNLQNLIIGYRVRYPNNKFITEQEVNNICAKYGLLFGNIDRYIGDIPRKNLMEIKDFNTSKVRKEDRSYSILRHFSDPIEADFKTYERHKDTDLHWGRGVYHFEFKICAPIKEMLHEKSEIKNGYRIESVPDPIVLFPVYKGYLIVSKWGLEGQDASLTNEMHN